LNTHNVILWGTESCHVIYELESASPKVNVWCGVTHNKVYDPFFFAEETVHWGPYLNMLQLFLMPQLHQENMNTVIFQWSTTALVDRSP
jgi:hypothetical protein